MTRVISASTGINGVSLAIISPKQARYVDYLFSLYFSKQALVGNFLRKVKKLFDNFFFLRNYLKVINSDTSEKG